VYFDNIMMIYLLFQQVRVRAYDNGVPPKEAIAIVKVIVNRNLRCPQWRSGDKTVEIFENLDIGQEVASVKATDSDDQVIDNSLCDFS